MDALDIIKKLREILQSFFDEPIDFENDEEEYGALQVLVSHSVKAVNFVVLVEDEFEVEFDDDIISVDFFQNLSYIRDQIISIQSQ